MKVVKSLLLGSAAGFAVAGAHAADLPVKAKPVEYVKVCSLYGAGYYYIPGTDTCIKVGGYMRMEYQWNASGGFAFLGSALGVGAGLDDRKDTPNLTSRARASMSFDVRTQTEYGTLRSYIRGTAQVNTPTDPAGGAPFYDRGFVQFAGFTAGKTQSYFDSPFAASGLFSYYAPFFEHTTIAQGINVLAYTATLPNGFSATISLEDTSNNGRRHPVVNASIANQFGIGAATPVTSAAGQRLPDVVANLRVDQTWGSAQIMAALHDASASYYSGTGFGCSGPAITAGTAPLVSCGHPSDIFGWAVGAGVLALVPWFPGDQFGIGGTYAVGAVGYTTYFFNPGTVYSGNTVGFGFGTDGVYVNGSQVELTTSWQVQAGYQHRWTPTLATSIYGGYLAVQYNGTAQGYLCGTAAIAGANLNAGTTVLTNNCSPNFAIWEIGSRTQWNPVPNLDVGIDIMYSKFVTGFGGSTLLLPAVGARPTGIYTATDQDVWSGIFRMQRNFWP